MMTSNETEKEDTSGVNGNGVQSMSVEDDEEGILPAPTEQSIAEQQANAAAILQKIRSPMASKPTTRRLNPAEIRSPEAILGIDMPKHGRAKGSKNPTANTKINKIMGDGESYRFYKIERLGGESLIRDYSARELANANNDIELFIQTYLVDEFGDGQYKVLAYNAKGEQVRDEMYSVLAPKSSKRQPNTNGTAPPSLLEQNMVQSQHQQLMRLQEEQRDADRRARELAEKANQDLQLKMMAMQKGEGNSSMTMMMMMMQMQQAQQAQQAEAQRRADLQREQFQVQQQIAQAQMEATRAAVPLPPPPPPAPTLVEQMQQMHMMREMFTPPPTPPVPTFIEQMQQMQLMRDMFAPPESKTVKDVVQEMNEFDALAQQRYGPTESTVATVLAGFLENFADNMHALKEVIAAQPGAPTQRGPQAQQLPPGLPEGFEETMAQLNDADTDERRIQVVMAGLKLLGESGVPKYGKFVMRLVNLVKSGNQVELNKSTKVFLEELAGKGIITQKAAEATFKTFDRHFNYVVAAVTGKAPEAEEAEEAEEEEEEEEEEYEAEADPDDDEYEEST